MKWISRVFSFETSWNVSFWVDSSIITLIEFVHVVSDISLECGWLGRSQRSLSILNCSSSPTFFGSSLSLCFLKVSFGTTGRCTSRFDEL